MVQIHRECGSPEKRKNDAAELSHTLSVLVAGDLNMRAPLDALIGSGREAAIFEELGPLFERTDVRLCNLENPLTDGGEPIPKIGPNLRGPEAGVSIIAAAGFDAAVLANNHIGDYGAEGVARTLRVLDSHGIGRTGAGMDLHEARRPWITRRGERTLAVVSVTENQFGTASAQRPGGSGFDMRRLCADVISARERADFVLIVFHGGQEHNPVPSPGTVDRYRSLVDAGADAIVGMHSHCPQGWEIYRGKPIVYSTGNFLFCSRDPLIDPGSPWFFGYLPRIEFSDVSPRLTLHPYRFTADGRRVHLLAGEEKRKFMDYLGDLSAVIADPAQLIAHYESWCVLKAPGCLARLRGGASGGSQQTAVDDGLYSLHCFATEALVELLRTYLRILYDGREAACAQGIAAVEERSKIPFPICDDKS